MVDSETTERKELRRPFGSLRKITSSIEGNDRDESEEASGAREQTTKEDLQTKENRWDDLAQKQGRIEGSSSSKYWRTKSYAIVEH